MKTYHYFILIVAIIGLSFRSDKPAYRIFNPKGKDVSYSKMIEELKGADIILFGEFHDNPVIHWLELSVTKDLFEEKKDRLILGAEMFEADNQISVNEYLDSVFTDSKFEEDARLWKNYKTDYKPLLSFARKNHLHFIATNIPRRYASVVFSKGFEGLESLSAEAKSYMAPLPVLYDTTLECYRKMLDMKEGMGGRQHSSKNLPKAQAIKDATMAYFIMKNWSEGRQVLHFNGSYHSDRYEGIVWYLRQINKDLRIVTVAASEQDQLDSMKKESYGMGDFIITVDEDMTKTY